MKETGIVIIAIAFIISVVSPYAVFLIGIPVFLLGLLSLWQSKAQRRTKLIWSIAPPVLWFPLTTLWLFIYNSIGQLNAQKKDFYISEDFRGSVVIVESICGNDPILKEDRLQFEIPMSGVYMFNGELESGHIDRRVFLRKESGELVQLENGIRPTKLEDKDTTKQERIIGYWGGVMGTRGESTFISVNIETNKVYSDKQEWRIKREQEQLIDSLLTDCK